jgi:hypothetical protein
MLAILHDWQELAGGILALIAGTFIFLQGALERRANEKSRLEDAEKERDQARLILSRLDQASSDLLSRIERFIEILEDVLTAIDRGDSGIELPEKISVPKLFEVIFAQLTTQDISIQVYIELSLLLEKAAEYDTDFRRFLVVYGQTVTEWRSPQPRLPLGLGDGRHASEEPAAQTLLISTRSLQDVLIELKSRIAADLQGD